MGWSFVGRAVLLFTRWLVVWFVYRYDWPNEGYMTDAKGEKSSWAGDKLARRASRGKEEGRRSAM